jgi:Spy/CpxP family protein refolding chaperone
MKASKIMVLFALLAVGVALFFSACHDRSNINGPREFNFEIAQFAIIDISDVENGIEDATTESDMTFNSTMLNYSVMGGDGNFAPMHPGLMGMRWFDRYDFGKHLGFFFRQLNLTDDQKSAIRDLARTFHDNMRPLVRQFYDANKTIIQEANTSRKAIMDQVTAGTLTRAEAAVKIKDLNQKTRDKIKANPDSQPIKTEMCAERDKLFAGVKGKLQGDQITKWDNWIAKIKDPCVP